MTAAMRKATAASGRRKGRDPELRAARAERLRRAGRGGGVVLLLAALVGAGGYGIHYLTSPEVFPLQAVRFDSELRHVRERDLRQALDPHLDGGFWSLDVERIRRALESLEWVEFASVRRVWPGLLRVTIGEQEAVASWNDAALLNARGQIFSPPRETWPGGLPQLDGPANRAEAVARRMEDLNRALDNVDGGIKALSMDARESWSVTLDSGATINLGREDVSARLRRFIVAYPHLQRSEGDRLASADLRYPNGFAVRWKNDSGDMQ